MKIKTNLRAGSGSSSTSTTPDVSGQNQNQNGKASGGKTVTPVVYYTRCAGY